MADLDLFIAAARALLAGQSPYSVVGFFNPAWTLLPFIPLTLFPLNTSRLIYSIVTIAGTLYALYRLHLSPFAIVVVTLFTPLLWINLIAANVDWIVLLGVSLAPKWGAWLLSMKPQMSFGVFGLWAGQRRYKPLIVIAVALLLNYAIFGLPNLRASNSLIGNGNGYTASLFPVGVPVALYWFTVSLKRNDRGLALALSALCAPYYSLSSVLSLAPLARTRRGLFGVVVLSWLLFFLWRYAILK